MADFKGYMRNNEQRIRRSLVGTIKAIMPGEQPSSQGTQHIVGYLPTGAVIDNATAYIKDDFGASVTVDFGTEAEPKKFMDGRVLTISSNTDNTTPLQHISMGEPVVITYDTTGTNKGTLFFEIGFTERNTRAGKYTA